jgi:uncharacterized repeat protein (TIGR03943 family)
MNEQRTFSPLAELAAVAPSTVFLAWTFALVWLITTGYHGTFLQPQFVPLLLFATLTLLIFANAAIGRERDRHSGGVTLMRAAILIVPLVYLGFVFDEELGEHALKTKGIEAATRFSTGGFSEEAKLPDKQDGDLELTLLQILANKEELVGRRVTTIGMVCQDPRGSSEDEQLLFRFLMVCCAADARPVAVRAVGEPSVAGDDRWVELTGTVQLEEDTPLIMADKIVPISPPANRFLEMPK